MQDQGTLFAIVAIALVLLTLVLWYFNQRARTRALRETFGEEYDRTVSAKGGRRDAEAELQERQARVEELEIRPLDDNQRMRFTGQWQEAKALFVDSPVEAVARGDRIIGEMMNARGYPMGDFERRHGDLTVHHQDVAKHYLEGHEIAQRSGAATTEELRRAINHYEKLFHELIASEDAAGDPAAHQSQMQSQGTPSPAEPPATGRPRG